MSRSGEPGGVRREVSAALQLAAWLTRPMTNCAFPTLCFPPWKPRLLRFCSVTQKGNLLADYLPFHESWPNPPAHTATSFAEGRTGSWSNL